MTSGKLKNFGVHNSNPKKALIRENFKRPCKTSVCLYVFST